MDEMKWPGLIRLVLVPRDGPPERIAEHVEISVDDELLAAGKECEAKVPSGETFWIEAISVKRATSSSVPQVVAKRVDNVGRCTEDLRALTGITPRIERARLFKRLSDDSQISELKRVLAAQLQALQDHKPSPDDPERRPVEELQNENAWMLSIPVILKEL